MAGRIRCYTTVQYVRLCVDVVLHVPFIKSRVAVDAVAVFRVLHSSISVQKPFHHNDDI